MDLLKDLTDAQVLEIAARPTPKPVEGLWYLLAPDGRVFNGNSPMECITAEINDRIPPLIALARIRRALIEPDAPDRKTDRRQTHDRKEDCERTR